MKNLINGALRCNGKTFALHQSLTSIWSILLVTLVFTSCKKENLTSSTFEEVQSKSNHTKITEADVVNEYSGLSFQTKWELQQARAATAKYRNISNAIKDGYIDISVRVENMGHHYLNPGLLDGTFDVRKPEILVYNKDDDGNFHLVAVEYAVPINEPMPQGFTGLEDVWDGNTGFGLWLLHAWVWTYNPAGVFNPTNPLVHLHL
jgi:hypothetical protein